MSNSQKLAKARENGHDDRTIDVDAFRSARLEKLGPPPAVKLAGREFILPQELPATVVHGLGRTMQGDYSAVVDILRSLFGEHWEAIQELAPSWPDQEFIIERTMEIYGVKPPE